MAKGKWAQGIKPRNFHWIINDQIAICERPGGYGESHRRVRRQEEIIWVRENAFDLVISIIVSPHNLHNYDELDVRWMHRPFIEGDTVPEYQKSFYSELKNLVANGSKVLIHRDELADHVTGLLAGYLLWDGLVKTGPDAIVAIEQLVPRQLGPLGRELVANVGALGS